MLWCPHFSLWRKANVFPIQIKWGPLVGPLILELDKAARGFGAKLPFYTWQNRLSHLSKKWCSPCLEPPGLDHLIWNSCTKGCVLERGSCHWRKPWCGSQVQDQKLATEMMQLSILVSKCRVLLKNLKYKKASWSVDKHHWKANSLKRRDHATPCGNIHTGKYQG